jgi:hypothetical protein
MDQLRAKLLGQKQEPTLYDEFTESCPSLSIKQRMIAFGICLGLGLLFCFLSLLFLPSIVTRPSAFAIPYTCGNILAISATGFLVGPLKQLKMMWKPSRIIASLLFIGAMVMTLVSAFVLGIEILVLLSVLVQFFALIWYCLSYIPYARSCVKTLFSSAVSV